MTRLKRAMFLCSNAAAVLCCTLAVGCSRSAIKPVPVTGLVTVDGKPAAGATVIFHPDGQAAPGAPRPVGQADANGEFRLTTAAANDGAAPGEYRVTVAWYAVTPSKRVTEGDDAPPRSLVPEKFNKAETTPLRATVSPESTGPVTIDVRRK